MIRAAVNEVQTLLLAVQFLTRLPAAPEGAYTEARFRASVRYYPLVGVLIGVVAAGLFAAANMLWNVSVALLVSTGLTMLLTGAFHEDGLADTVDGIGGGATPQKALEIMKDSRIGVFGAVALSIVIGLKIVSLNALPPHSIAILLIAAHGLSRLSSVLVIANSQYVRQDGSGKPTAENISTGGLLVALVSGAACAGLMYWQLSVTFALAAVAGVIAGHVLSRLFYQPRIGGYTGDCLGATQQISEVGAYLGVLACQ